MKFNISSKLHSSKEDPATPAEWPRRASRVKLNMVRMEEIKSILAINKSSTIPIYIGTSQPGINHLTLPPT
jgi:hypothetical protein